MRKKGRREYPVNELRSLPVDAEFVKAPLKPGANPSRSLGKLDKHLEIDPQSTKSLYAEYVF